MVGEWEYYLWVISGDESKVLFDETKGSMSVDIVPQTVSFLLTACATSMYDENECVTSNLMRLEVKEKEMEDFGFNETQYEEIKTA